MLGSAALNRLFLKPLKKRFTRRSTGQSRLQSLHFGLRNEDFIRCIEPIVRRYDLSSSRSKEILENAVMGRIHRNQTAYEDFSSPGRHLFQTELC